MPHLICILAPGMSIPGCHWNSAFFSTKITRRFCWTYVNRRRARQIGRIVGNVTGLLAYLVGRPPVSDGHCDSDIRRPKTNSEKIISSYWRGSGIDRSSHDKLSNYANGTPTGVVRVARDEKEVGNEGFDEWSQFYLFSRRWVF